MKYLEIKDDGTVGDIIPEFEDIFPDIPIDQRYTADFLNTCVAVDDDVDVLSGDGYKDGNIIPRARFKPRPTEAELYQTIEDNLIKTRNIIALAAPLFNNATVLGLDKDLFDNWETSFFYVAKTVVTYDGELYRCLQDHTSQDDWTPNNAVSLWTRIADPEIEYPDWVQPLGAHDAYMADAKVVFNGKYYKSITDNNVYPPNVHGWEEVIDHEL